MPRLTVRFESACVFVPRPGLGLDVCFANVPHHATLLRTSPPVLLRRCRVELLFDGSPARPGDCVVTAPRPVDLARVWPGAMVRPSLRTRQDDVPGDLDAWVWLGGGTLAGGFTDESLKYVWDVPNHQGGIVLTDRARYVIEHDARDVAVRFTASDEAGPPDLPDVPVAAGGRDAEVEFATEDPEDGVQDPALGFELDEFRVLTGVLDEETSEMKRPVPTLIAKSSPPSTRRSGRPVCSNALLTLA
jgi:hypothetical protein